MRPKILIIEDEFSLQLTLKTYLSDTYECLTASSGKQALKILRSIIPKAVLVDLNLPDMNGIEIVEHIDKHHKKVAILILTGDKKENTVKKAIECGADSYLTKPFNPQEIHSRIEQAIYRKLFSNLQ